MPDIQTREDINYLLQQFYTKALKDEVIGYFFTEVVQIKLAEHLPVIGDFWEMVILGGHQYKKNAIAIHQHLHHLSPLEKKHFDRWLQLFTGTVDELYSGSNAVLASQRAVSIATIMKIKILHSSPINTSTDDDRGSTTTG